MMPIADMSMLMLIGLVVRVVRIFRVVSLIDAEHSFHATNDAANRCADDGTDRAGDAAAFIIAMNGASGNALSLCGNRHGERCETCAANQQFHFHYVTSFWIEG